MTLNELYRKALEKLRVVAAGDPAAPEDTQVVADKYRAVYAMLLGLRLVTWAENEDVPEEAVLPLTAMLAFAAADDFGKDSARYALEGAIGFSPPSLGERQLRQQLARRYVHHPATPAYF